MRLAFEPEPGMFIDMMERYAEHPSESATLVLRCSKWNAGKLDRLIEKVGGRMTLTGRVAVASRRDDLSQVSGGATAPTGYCVVCEATAISGPVLILVGTSRLGG